mgnify:CR=1 FL=1
MVNVMDLFPWSREILKTKIQSYSLFDLLPSLMGLEFRFAIGPSHKWPGYFHFV